MSRAPANAYPRSRRRRYKSRLYRRQSPLMAMLVPIASVLIASMITTLPILSSLPLLWRFGVVVAVGVGGGLVVVAVWRWRCPVQMFLEKGKPEIMGALKFDPRQVRHTGQADIQVLEIDTFFLRFG